MSGHLAGKNKDKNKTKSYGQKTILLSIILCRQMDSIHCELKLNKQDLQPGES